MNTGSTGKCHRSTVALVNLIRSHFFQQQALAVQIASYQSVRPPPKQPSSQSSALKRPPSTMLRCLPWPRQLRLASSSSDDEASARKMPQSAPSAVQIESNMGPEGYIFAVSETRYIAPSSKQVRRLRKLPSLASRVDLIGRRSGLGATEIERGGVKVSNCV